MRVYINLVHDYNDICKYSIIFDFFQFQFCYYVNYEGYINVCNP